MMRHVLSLGAIALLSGGCALVYSYGDYRDETTTSATSSSGSGGGSVSSSSSGTGGATSSSGGTGGGGGGAGPVFGVDWALRAGDGQSQLQAFNQALITPSGDVVVAGSYVGSVDVGGTMIASPNVDVVVAKLSGATGAPVWVKGNITTMPTGGSKLPRYNTSVALGNGGEVIVAGSLTTLASATDGILLGLSSDGVEQYLKTFDNGGADAKSALAAGGPNNRVWLLAEAVNGQIRFATEQVPAGPSSLRDFALASCDVAGCANPVVQSFGGPDDDFPEAIAMAPDGGVFITGSYKSPFAGLPDAGTLHGIYVAKFDISGALVWAKGFPKTQTGVCAGMGMDRPRGKAIAVLNNGDVVVAGTSCGETMAGSITVAGSGAADAFVAKLAGLDGNVLWARAFGDGAQQVATGVAVDAGGTVFVTGTFAGTLDLGPGKVFVAQSGTQRIFLAKLGGLLGDPVEAAAYGAGDPVQSRVISVAAAPGALVIAGAWEGDLDFGDGKVLSAQGGLDAFVAHLSP